MTDFKSLKEIFNNIVFRIPDYQRGYAWTEPQIIDFWNDLVNLVEKHHHYTGMISLKQIDTEEDKAWSKKDNWIIGEGYKALCYILLFAGLRIREEIALQWKNVNFENKTLKVERSVTQVPKFDSEIEFFQDPL